MSFILSCDFIGILEQKVEMLSKVINLNLLVVYKQRQLNYVIRCCCCVQQCVNASLTLCEMIRLSRENTQDSYQSSSDPNQQQTDSAPLHAKLESKDTIERLLNNVFSSENPSNGLVISGLSVLLVILTDK